MKSVLVAAAISTFALLVCFRIGNAMLIHEDADILVDANLCQLLHGQQVHPDLCRAHADVSHDLLGNTLLKLPDQTVVELEPARVHGMAYARSHFDLWKGWH
jgi:hypothetical protein